MLLLFMILVLIAGIFTIYTEIKNKESSEKLFYTFYLLGMFSILFPFLKIVDFLVVYIIFYLLYLFLLHSIYTNFSLFTKLGEFFISSQKISKESIYKLDINITKLIKQTIENINKEFNITIYSEHSFLLDFSIIVILSGIILYFFIINYFKYAF